MGQRLEDCIRGFTPPLTDDYKASSVHCAFNTGAAGTGKTYNEKKAIEENPNYGILCATTGIAAINLGASTLNSVLKFFDTASLRDRFDRGKLTSTLHGIGRRTKRLVIDEVSMMDGKQLDYIYQAMFHVNTYADMAPKLDKDGLPIPGTGPMGIVLTGDFAQLPPIKAKWAFEADCWEHFERNTNTLTKIWRQDNLQFLEAINAARAGKGQICAEILKSIGVKFVPQLTKFDGTTIMSKNDQVDNFNFSALMDLPGEPYGLKTAKWGDESGEWKNIPEMLKLKDGALVMILANETGGFTYANGDTGHIREKNIDGTIWVTLKRNGQTVPIRPIVRHKSLREDDAEKSLDKTFPGERNADCKDPWNTNDMEHIFCEKECAVSEPGIRYGAWGRPSYNCSAGSINVGAIKYYPLRLAYATTVHKSQGLTLDTCQIDCRDHFFGNPSMAYVALSRCRTPQGLTIVGTPEKLADRIKIEPKVRRWL